MNTEDANNMAESSDYSMESFEGTINNLEEIFQFKIGSELDQYTFNFTSDANYEEFEKRKESKNEFITELVSELISEVCSKLPENASKEHIDIDKMTLQEILEKLRCKCKEMKSKLCNKYRDDEAEDDDAGVKAQGDMSDIPESITSVSSELEENDESLDLNEYLGIREYAIQFVGKLLGDARKICAGTTRYSALNYEKPAWDPRESSKYYNAVTETGESCDDEEENMFQLPMLTIRDFTPELGKDLVQNYVKTWYVTKDWRYWIEYKALRIDTGCDFHEYEVIWSLPTREYPIPQMTVTVFFTITVSRVIPDLCPVNVRYYFETCATEFSLKDEVHHNAFLYDILCQKQRTLCAIRI